MSGSGTNSPPSGSGISGPGDPGHLRDAIVSLLALPRRLLRDQVLAEPCGHAGFFAPGAGDCRRCLMRLECEWLFHADEAAPLDQKSIEELAEALGHGVAFIDAAVTRARHDRVTCRCERCAWLRRARRTQAHALARAPWLELPAE